jgi:putative transposase
MSKRQTYPSDLTDEQWEIVWRMLPRRRTKVGHPVTVDRRAIVNAIFYVLRTGCQWRQLPHDFPPWGTVSSQFYRWRHSGAWERIHNRLHGWVRQEVWKKARPTGGIIDSQSVKTTEQGGSRGYDAGKRINGRKRHVMVDTLGLLIAVFVHPANIQDYDGAKEVMRRAKQRFPRLKRVWADSAYGRNHLPDWAFIACTFVLDVVHRVAGAMGFVVLPKRWVVERTFAWLGRSRRLARDYERSAKVSETLIHVAMIKLMLRRLSL